MFRAPDHEADVAATGAIPKVADLGTGFQWTLQVGVAGAAQFVGGVDVRREVVEGYLQAVEDGVLDCPDEAGFSSESVDDRALDNRGGFGYLAQ